MTSTPSALAELLSTERTALSVSNTGVNSISMLLDSALPAMEAVILKVCDVLLVNTAV